jgi:hypothetical protein
LRQSAAHENSLVPDVLIWSTMGKPSPIDQSGGAS